MRLILALGFALFEVLVSLLLLSLALLGLDGMLLSALQASQKAFFRAKAEQQMHNLEERLQAGDENLLQTIEDWNQENKMILPQGQGSLAGSAPDYMLTLCWGDPRVEGACLYEKWRGATLIELMITFTLSLIVMMIATGLFLAIEKQNELLNSWAVEEDRARFILQRLESELHLAGFIGCPRLTDDFPLGNNTMYTFNASNKLLLQSDPSGSSILILKYRSATATHLLETMHQSSLLVLSSAFAMKPGALLLISDCRHADLFQVADIEIQGQRQQVRTTQPLVYRYGEKAEIGVFNIRSYFVKKTGRKDRAGREVSALYLKDRDRYPMELVEGVQKLQVTLKTEGRGVHLQLQLALKDSFKTEYGFVALRN